MEEGGFMKRFISVLTIFLYTCLFANAETLSFIDGEYSLKDVTKEKPNYTNTYIRPSQTLDNWTGMLKVQYLPKEESDFDFINNYLSKVAQNPQVRIISFYPEISVFSYGIISKNGEEGHIEYNVVKCKKDKKSGLDVLQYTHKYKFKDKESLITATENCYKYNMQYTNALVKTDIPEIKKKK